MVLLQICSRHGIDTTVFICSPFDGTRGTPPPYPFNRSGF